MTAEEFKSTILANYRRMYAAALAMLANSDDASDAVQDTVARLWERRESLGDVDSPASFCIKAIRNACIDRIRSRAEANVPIDADFRHPASAEQADDEVSLQMSQSAIERAIAALPAPQQRVIRLSAYSCCTNDEIAAQTGFSDSNVRQLLSRARKTLRTLLLPKNAL